MRYYLVIHDVPSFQQHGDWIGRKAKIVPPDFQALSRGDGIVYYCKEDLVVTGTFKVGSAPRLVDDDGAWEDRHVVVTIEPVAEAEPPHYVPVKKMLEELDPPLTIFPEGKLRGIKLRGRTFVPITKQDFQAVTRYVRAYKHENVLFQGPSNDAGLGQPGNFGAMNYAPTSEQGVVALFVWHMKTLGFVHLEFIRQGFPDACAIEAKGTTYERKYIEFEYKSSGFRQHVNSDKHRNIRCDYVVCWEHDYPTCPVPVIELRSRVEWALPPAERPAAVRVSMAPEKPPSLMKPAPKAEARPAPRQKKARQERKSPALSKVGIAELVQQGLLKPDQELRLNWRGKSFSATVQSDGSILFDGKEYTSPSAAGQAARNGMSTNGWVYWKCFDGHKWVQLARLRGADQG